MAYIPHTPDDVARMLEVIGVGSIEELFDEIPAELRAKSLSLPAPMSEMEVARLLTERAALDGRPLNHRHARRVLFRLHAVSGRGQPGHAAIDL